jgi:cell filamentation protein
VTEPVPEWQQRWNQYLWEPGGTVLRNKLGLRDGNELHTAEYRIRADRQLEIQRGDVDIPRTFDQDHVKALHKHLFQDVYEWAGQFREVDIAKNDKPFALQPSVGAWVDHVGEMIRNQDWANMSRDDFVWNMSAVYAYQNCAHPFREGNGATCKLLISQVAEMSPYRLDFDRVEKSEWDNASRESLPDDPRIMPPNPHKVTAVFDKIAVDRDPVAAPGVDPELAKSMQLQNTTYDARSTGTAAGQQSAATQEGGANLGERPQTYDANRQTGNGTGREA